MLGDWLVVSQVLPVNPATAVRGPKHVVTKGATPVLSPAEARKLLELIDTGALAGLRDRALLSVMLYSFARVSAVLGMRRQDYFGQGSRGWLRLHAKPRWLLSIPDAISQLEQLDRTLLTRRDVERLFGVSKARAATLMQTFGAELTGNQRTLPRTKLLQNS